VSFIKICIETAIFEEQNIEHRYIIKFSHKTKYKITCPKRKSRSGATKLRHIRYHGVAVFQYGDDRCRQNCLIKHEW